MTPAIFCESEFVEAEKTPWVLAARKFNAESARSKSAEAAASVIPKLILERISVDLNRDVLRDEKISRKTDALLTERLSLFLQLSKEIQARDSLVLNNYSTIEFEMAVHDQQKKIKEIQDKIDANLERQELVFHPEKGKKKLVKELGKELAPQKEIVTLYKNDSEALFAASSDAESEGVYSRKYAREISSAKINSLITGSMVFYGEYVSVQVDLLVYPGAKKAASAMEVGSLSQISRIAENLSFELLPKIANGLPVELNFNINPAAALKSAILTIDNIVYDPIPDKAIVSAGLHSIALEADNYARETFVYDFSGSRRFFIDVNFKEKSEGSVKLVLSRFVPGNMFFDGKFVGPSSKTDYVDVPLKVNGDTVFGYFEGTYKDKQEMMFMQIPANLMVDGNLLETKMKVFDISKNIDKRRKIMYVSYSALILSLPFLFYSYGRFFYYQRARTAGYGDVASDTYNTYRQMSLWATGISAACGVWFVAELVAYLIAVDKTLPPKARKVRRGTVRRMENSRQLEAVQTMMQGEADAISPLMPKRQEEDKPEGGEEIGPKEKDGSK
ncbi:MAG: hypothetical protein IJS51_10855 [Treponema sp.]|nr:hypothetical protein [Treponema sp.]